MELKDILNYELKAPPKSRRQEGDGSIIVILATDAPLLPHQLKRIAQRVPLGIGKVGGRGSNGSGDIFLTFSTANENAFNRPSVPFKLVITESRLNQFLNQLIPGLIRIVRSIHKSL